MKDKANYELSRLKSMNSSSSEGNVIKGYLDWLLDIPWSKNTKESIDIIKSRKILDDEHYGLRMLKIGL